MTTSSTSSDTASSPRSATAVLALAALVLTYELLSCWYRLPTRDLGAFYDSGHQWLAQRTLYVPAHGTVNLNPPHVSVLLFAPLARLPLSSAAAAWLALQGLAFIVGLVLLARDLRLSASGVRWLVAWVLLSRASQHQWSHGQIGGLLFLLAVLAWRAHRHQQSPAWAVALLASIKPWALCWLPCLSWRDRGRVLALGSLGLVAGLLLGFAPWLAWIDTLRQMPLTPVYANLSLRATLARLSGQALVTDPLAAWVPPVSVLASGLLVALVARRHRALTADQQWIAWGVVGVLVSPIGWDYYLLTIYPALWAYGEAVAWPWSLRLVLLGLCAPPWLLLALGPIVGGNLLAACTLLLLGLMLVRERQVETSDVLRRLAGGRQWRGDSPARSSETLDARLALARYARRTPKSDRVTD